MRSYLSAVILAVILGLFITGCGTPASPKQEEYIKNHQKLYTQRAVWIKQHRGSNVFVVVRPFTKSSTVLPTNSEVVIDGFKGDLVLSYRGRYVKFLHLKPIDKNGKRSKEGTQAFVDELLQLTKVDMHNYSEDIQESIHTNVVIKGMDREAVTLAVGKATYPETFSYYDDRWYFSNHKHKTILTVIFKDNKVIKVKDERVVRTKEQ